jgi:hypothetical protein
MLGDLPEELKSGTITKRLKTDQTGPASWFCFCLWAIRR